MLGISRQPQPVGQPIFGGELSVTKAHVQRVMELHASIQASSRRGRPDVSSERLLDAQLQAILKRLDANGAAHGSPLAVLSAQSELLAYLDAQLLGALRALSLPPGALVALAVLQASHASLFAVSAEMSARVHAAAQDALDDSLGDKLRAEEESAQLLLAAEALDEQLGAARAEADECRAALNASARASAKLCARSLPSVPAWLQQGGAVRRPTAHAEGAQAGARGGGPRTSPGRPCSPGSAFSSPGRARAPLSAQQERGGGGSGGGGSPPAWPPQRTPRSVAVEGGRAGSSAPSLSSARARSPRPSAPPPVTSAILRRRAPATAAAARALSAGEARELAHALVASKEAHDARCDATAQPRETLAAHVGSFFSTKYGVRALVLEWVHAANAAVNAHRQADADVGALAAMLAHQVDEGYWPMHTAAKAVVVDLLRAQLRARAPNASEAAIGEQLRARLGGKALLREAEWSNVLAYMHTQPDALALAAQLRDLARAERSGSGDSGGGVAYGELVGAVCRFQLAQHRSFLRPFGALFRQVDDDRDGCITLAQLATLHAAMRTHARGGRATADGDADEAAAADEELRLLLARADPLGVGRLTYSQVVCALSAQIVQLATGLGNGGGHGGSNGPLAGGGGRWPSAEASPQPCAQPNGHSSHSSAGADLGQSLADLARGKLAFNE